MDESQASTPASRAEKDPPPQSGLARFFHPLGEMTVRDERIALVLKALIVAGVFTWGKWAIHNLGGEFIENVAIMTALLGGVSFTLAILLNATLVDYKESERIVGELVTSLRRLHWDLPMIRQDAALLTRADHELLAFVRTLRADLRKGFSIKLSRIYPIIEAIDRTIVHLSEGLGRLPVVRTAQVGLGNIVRIVDRLEVIMETSFTRTGYTFAGAVTFGSLTLLAFTRFGSLGQALTLYGFAVFLLAGLFLLIWDLDNPFSGHARVNPYQLDKLEAYLRDHIGASHTPPA